LELSDETIIHLSKNKIILLVLGSMIFVLGGFWLLHSSITQNDPIYVKAMLLSFIGLFGTFGVYAIIKLFDSKPGLVLNSYGIIDNSSFIAAGQILWDEIQGFREIKVSGQEMLVVLVCNPDKYLNSGNALRRALNKGNFKMVGSPISISANTLKIKYDKLIELCISYHQRYRQDDK